MMLAHRKTPMGACPVMASRRSERRKRLRAAEERRWINGRGEIGRMRTAARLPGPDRRSELWRDAREPMPVIDAEIIRCLLRCVCAPANTYYTHLYLDLCSRRTLLLLRRRQAAMLAMVIANLPPEAGLDDFYAS
jgi:hypothetical protein